MFVVIAVQVVDSFENKYGDISPFGAGPDPRRIAREVKLLLLLLLVLLVYYDCCCCYYYYYYYCCHCHFYCY